MQRSVLHIVLDPLEELGDKAITINLLDGLGCCCVGHTRPHKSGHDISEAELPIPALPSSACRGHILPALASHSLISIGKLRDQGFTTTFDATLDVLWSLPSNTALLTLSSSPADNIPSFMQ